MAQEGVRLLVSLIDSGSKGFAKFLDYQFSEDMFRGDEQVLYKYCRAHAMKYGKLPDRKTLKKFAKGESIPLPTKDDITEPPEYYYDGIEERNLKLNLLKAMKGAEELRMDSPEKSLEILTSRIVELNHHKQRTRLINIIEDGADIIDAEFAKVLHGEEGGLQFGWPTLDAMSGGLRGGDLVSIVGRPGMGKTYMALHGMINAWNTNYTTLFVSMEMQATPIVQRVVSMYTHTSIGELKTGQVSSKKYKKVKRKSSN